MTFVFTLGELAAVGSLLIPALIVGVVHAPPEIQITKARVRGSRCRRGSEQ